MGKQSKKKSERIAQAIVLSLFVLVAAAGSLAMLDLIRVTELARTIIGYGLGTFAAFAFGVIAFKSVQE